ncbi:MAG TPA: PDZ domain-containing protein [Planctomycetaceae bacterium]|jgi:serine protease Do
MDANQLRLTKRGGRFGGVTLSVGVLLLLTVAAPRARADVRESVQRALPATVFVEWHDTAAKAPPANPAVPQKTVSEEVGKTPPRTVVSTEMRYRAVRTTMTALNQVGMASGTIVSADGLIVTMIEPREGGEYSVTLGDGRALTAHVLVDDRRTGLKLLKIDAAGLPFLEPLNQPPQIGEDVTWTYCLGAKERAAARGIIATTGRDLPGMGTNLLQLDSGLAIGSAGAPVVDEQGRLLGIVAINRVGPTQRIGFAVPVSAVQALLEVRRGDQAVVVQRGMIGISLSRTDANAPVVVAHPTPDSPAAAAGIRDGDEVLAIDGAKVGLPEEVMRLVSRHAAGEKVKVTIRRDGKEQDFEVTLTPVPAANSAGGSSNSSGSGSSSSGIGSVAAPVPATGTAQKPVKLTAIRPDSIYVVDAEGKLHAVPIEPGDKSLERVHRLYDSAAKAANDPLVAVPSIQIERSDMEKKIEQIGRDVLTLRQQMEKLTEELQRLQKQLSGGPPKP